MATKFVVTIEVETYDDFTAVDIQTDFDVAIGDYDQYKSCKISVKEADDE